MFQDKCGCTCTNTPDGVFCFVALMCTALDLLGNEPPPLSGASLSLFVTPFQIRNASLNETFTFGVSEWGGLLYGGSTITTTTTASTAPASGSNASTDINSSSTTSIEVSDALYLMLQSPGQQPYWLQIHRSPTEPWPGPRWRHTSIYLSAIAPPAGQSPAEEFAPYVLNVNTLGGASRSGYVVFGGMPSVSADALPIADTFVLQTGEGFMRSTSVNEPPARTYACLLSQRAYCLHSGMTRGVISSVYRRGCYFRHATSLRVHTGDELCPTGPIAVESHCKMAFLA